MTQTHKRGAARDLRKPDTPKTRFDDLVDMNAAQKRFVEAALRGVVARFARRPTRIRRQAMTQRVRRPRKRSNSRSPIEDRARASERAVETRTGDQRIRLLIAEGHTVTRMGLTTLFRSRPEFFVVGEALSGTEAVEAARRRRPDVILIDVQLPDKGGVEISREIQVAHPEIGVVLLCSRTEQDALLGSAVSGGVGLTLTEDPPEQLIDAVLRIATTGALTDSAVTAREPIRAQGNETPLPNDALSVLARHERNLLPLIAAGSTNREIAAQLALSEHTVKTYVSHILRKLNMRRRSQLASFITRCTDARADGEPATSSLRPRRRSKKLQSLTTYAQG